MLLLLTATLSLTGCKPSTLAPFPEFTEPELTLDTHGYFQGSTATIDGNGRGLTEITVNGQSAEREGEAYQATVPLERGVNRIEVTGVDERGDPRLLRQGVISGEFADPDAPVEEAVTVRLNNSGIDEAMDIVEDLVVAQDIPSLLTQFNPVYQGSYDVFGFEAGNVEVSIGSVDFIRPVLLADAKPGVIELTASIPYFEVQLDAVGSAVGIDLDEDVWVGADVIDVQLYLSAEVDSNGDLQITTTDPQINLVGFWFDVSLVPDALEGFLVDQVREVIETRVVETLDEMMPGLLEDRFAGLELTFDTEVLGKGLAIEGFLSDATIDDFGLELTTAIRIDAERVLDTGSAGYLSTSITGSDPSRLDDLSLTVSDNMLNNILFHAWRAGLLSLELDSARGDIDATLLTPLGATGAARVEVRAAVPPVMIERNGSAMVQITELLVRVETPNGEKGEFLDLSVQALVDLDLVVETGVLKLSLNDPEVAIDVRDSDWGLQDQSLTNLLAEQLPINTLLLLLGDIEIPLPSVAGISIDSAEAFRDASGVHTAIGANL